jgi:drug/metabolite transporter (DMT)-like permease
MLGFSALVAGSFSLGSLAAPLIDPAALSAVRFFLAGGVIGAAALATEGLPRSATRAPWRYGVLGGLLAIYFVAMFEGLKSAPPVSAAAVFTLTPIMAAGFGWLLLGQRLTPRITLALAIGAAGALWVIFRGNVAALVRLDLGRGEAIYFWGCVAHAAYTPMVRKLNRGEPAVIFTFGTLVAGCLLLMLWGVRSLLSTDWASLPPVFWLTLAYLVIFATATSFLCIQYATLRLPSSKVMAYTYLVPSWVILWQIALGLERPALAVLPGVLLTALALALLLKDETA